MQKGTKLSLFLFFFSCAEALLLCVIEDACAVDLVKVALVADGSKEVVARFLVHNIECNAQHGCYHNDAEDHCYRGAS